MLQQELVRHNSRKTLVQMPFVLFGKPVNVVSRRACARNLQD